MERKIKFTKMQGLGNDFILVDYAEIEKNNLNYGELAKIYVTETLELAETA